MIDIMNHNAVGVHVRGNGGFITEGDLNGSICINMEGLSSL